MLWFRNMAGGEPLGWFCFVFGLLGVVLSVAAKCTKRGL